MSSLLDLLCVGAGLRVVLYHHLADRPCPFTDELRIATPPDVFESHLRYYARNYDVVDLEAVLSGRLARKPLLVTFDDAYRSVLGTAGPMLKQHRIPAVFFIASAVVQGSGLMLDNLLCYLSHEVGIGSVESFITGAPATCGSLAELIGRVIAGLPYEARAGLGERLCRRFKVNQAQLAEAAQLYLKPDEVAQLADYGIEIGNHTASHVHGRILGEDDAVTEIVGAKRQLELWSGRRVRALSYPYGSPTDATDLVNEAAIRSGHQALFLVGARRNPIGHRGVLWYRTSLKGEPTGKLFRQIELLPRVRSFCDLISGRDGLRGQGGRQRSGEDGRGNA